MAQSSRVFVGFSEVQHISGHAGPVHQLEVCDPASGYRQIT